MQFLDRLLDEGVRSPGKIALRTVEPARSLTYGELCTLSGRVYAYLVSKGIGKEDFVMIHMPRSLEAIAFVYGVWRAGAACAVCETSMPAARVAFIREDCGCKITLSEKTLRELVDLPPLSGCAPIDLHDAAFAVYTSGSTGEPKGVIHEYGKLDLILDVDTQSAYDHSNQIFGCMAPLNTVLSILLYLPVLANGGILDLFPDEIIRDPRRMLKYIAQGNIRSVFFTPSYLKMLPKLPECMDYAFVGAERSEYIYRDEMKSMFNGYALSECGFTALYHTIRPGESNTAIGRSLVGLKAYLVDDERRPLTRSGMGELVIENPYTRGYIHSELNAGVFENGFLYTGDIAEYNGSGELVLLGRKDEMLKIRGNRIEPSEIENALRKVLGIQWVIVKGFEEDGIVTLCAYYKDKITFEPEEVKEALADLLPKYMIPNEFILLETVPMLPSGKVNKKALPKPSRKSARDYAAPESERQSRLCKAFARVLRLERVGIDDDFYQLGGDSLSAMILLFGLEEKVPLEILVRERTPRNIAAWLKSEDTDDQVLHAENWHARHTPQPLTAMQRYMLRYQMVTPYSTMWNLPMFLRFDKSRYPADSVCRIVEKILAAHPALQSIITLNRQGSLEQRWMPELTEQLHVERISEAELRTLQEELVRPFTLFNRHLVHCRLFETEEAGYLFLDIHHTMADGYSIRHLREQFLRMLNGGEPEEDLYYLYVSREDRMKDSPLYSEAETYYRATYGGGDWSMYPRVDHESRDNKLGTAVQHVPLSEETLQKARNHYGVTTNELCMAAFLLSIARYNRERNIQGVWVYNGRNDRIARDTVGLLFRIMPIALRFYPGQPMAEIFSSLREQIRRCIMYNCYPFALDMFESIQQDRASCFYQSDVADSTELSEYGFMPIDTTSRYGASGGVLDTSVYEDASGLTLHMDYAASRYEKESIDRFIGYVSETLCSMTRSLWETVDPEGLAL